MTTLPAATDKLLDQSAAAEILGVKESCLEQWRCRRQGPPFLKIGKKLVRYRAAELAAWLDSRAVPTAA